MSIHILRYGWTLCGHAWLPDIQPPEDRWVAFNDQAASTVATCVECILQHERPKVTASERKPAEAER